jgi:hypothetical protein
MATLRLLEEMRTAKPPRISPENYARAVAMVQQKCFPEQVFEVGSGVKIRDIVPSHRQMQAASDTLNVVEMLEAILLFLPAADILLRIRLVCKQFKNVVQDSVSLTQAVFRFEDLKCEPTYMPIKIWGIDGRLEVQDTKEMRKRVSIDIGLGADTSESLDRCIGQLDHYYVMQPPLRRFDLTITVENMKRYLQPKVVTEKHDLGEKGLTFGFLLEELRPMATGYDDDGWYITADVVGYLD